MKNFFNLDSPIMIFLSELADLIILNLVFLVSCIPIITIGPSITALHYVNLKMIKKEEGYIIRTFFRAWKENFKQSFMVWIIFLVVTAIFAWDFKIMQDLAMDENGILGIVIGAIYFFVCIVVMYTLVLLSYFSNTLGQTVKNAFLMSILHIFKNNTYGNNLCDTVFFTSVTYIDDTSSFYGRSCRSCICKQLFVEKYFNKIRTCGKERRNYGRR